MQNNETDFGEPLVVDMSTLPTIPPDDEQISISFNMSYDDVPSQSNEPEVHEKNETSKQPFVPISQVKTDKSEEIQSKKYNKYTLCAKIENIILRNETITIKSSQDKNFSNQMGQEVVLASPEKSKYFFGLSPARF